MKFKIGDRVKIKETSVYAGQSKEVGVIKSRDSHGWWTVEFPGYGNCYQGRDLTLVKGGKMPAKKLVKFVVAWEEDKDPCQEFYTKEEAEKHIAELLENNDVNRNSIVLYEIANRYEVKTDKFTLVEAKKN